MGTPMGWIGISANSLVFSTSIGRGSRPHSRLLALVDSGKAALLKPFLKAILCRSCESTYLFFTRDLTYWMQQLPTETASA